MKNCRLREASRVAAGVRLLLVCAFVGWCTAFGSTADAQTVPLDLLDKLKLSGYPSDMRPPDFQGSTTDGHVVSSGSLAGRVVLMNFWATWCLECRTEMPAFERLHRDFEPQGLSVLGINLREGAPAIRRYAQDLGLTFPLILDPRGRVHAAYGVIGLPTTFLIGRDGKAVGLAVGPRAWAGEPARRLIAALLRVRVRSQE